MLSLLASTLAQGPGNGLAKTTYTSSDPFPGLAFNLKYFPTTAAMDSCSGNYCEAGSFPDGEKAQGRAQLIDKGFYTARNCALYSDASGSASDSKVTSMSAPAKLGSDCAYDKGSKFASKTAMHWVFAPTADTCCKACAATSGCAKAEFHSGDDKLALAWDTDVSAAAPSRRALPPLPPRRSHRCRLVTAAQPPSALLTAPDRPPRRPTAAASSPSRTRARASAFTSST